MTALRELLGRSLMMARVAPFAVFLGLTSLQGVFGGGSAYWMYVVRTVAGAGLVWAVWPLVAEMRWRMSWEAVAAGVLVCVIWVGIDPWYPKIHFGKPTVPWNPHTYFGQDSPLAWFFIIVRIIGSGLVVPPLEEIFYRSFLYRYLVKEDFSSVPMGVLQRTPFLISAVVFGFAHSQWLAGILCAVVYQGLVVRKDRLGDAMTAHAITNILLGLWVAFRGAWQFW